MQKSDPLEAQVNHIHQDLVSRSQQGDRKAQQQLYQLYAKGMFNICTRLLTNTAEAQDVLQDSFIAAFRKLDQFQGKATFGAWLKKIVVNNCISSLKKQRMLTLTDPDELLEYEQPDEEDHDAQPDLDPEAIHQAIKTLPPGCRTVFTLYCLEGYDHEEIAGILQVSVSTSKSQYNRAKQLLRECLKKKGHAKR